MRQNLNLIWMAGLLISLSSCSFHRDKQSGKLGATEQENGSEESAQSEDQSKGKGAGGGEAYPGYKQVSETALSSCVQCHAPGQSAAFMPLTQYTEVKANIEGVMDSVRAKRMPKGRALDEDQLKLLERWYAAGYPEAAGVKQTQSTTVVSTTEESDNDSGVEATTTTPTTAVTTTTATTSVTPPDLSLDAAEVPKAWYETKNGGVEPIIKARCATCHGTKMGNMGKVNLETFAAVLEKVDEIEHAVFEKNSMPPGNALEDKLLAKLRAWIDSGTPLDEKGERRPTYASIQSQILGKKCVSCHTGENAAAGIRLDSYDGIMGSEVKGAEGKPAVPLVSPEKPSASRMVQVLWQKDKKFMPPSWSKIAALTPEEVALIKRWIKTGAKEN
jgi:uncharacterized membrane protein